jgi:hypothetical protein
MVAAEAATNAAIAMMVRTMPRVPGIEVEPLKNELSPGSSWWSSPFVVFDGWVEAVVGVEDVVEGWNLRALLPDHHNS